MYMLFNNNGFLDARLEKEPAIIPFGWFALPYQDVDGVYVWSDGKNIYGTDVPPPSIYHAWRDGKWIQNEKMLDALKEEKLKDLNDSAQAFIDTNSGANLVPDFEFASWSIQASEAKAWQLDKNAPTPVLDGIATARGIPADTLKAAALRKTLAYEQLAAHVAGQRQALQSKIEAAKTQAALDKIVITFTAPEAV
ncbi:hypothetical protein [Neisseria subflava]|uniref:hypothetical protein n=1 Tax=Neisseria subflava TaxID=28449 RepID=UPI001CB6BEEA|nr:hypothetical protein [Neisseria sp. KH1003-01]